MRGPVGAHQCRPASGRPATRLPLGSPGVAGTTRGLGPGMWLVVAAFGALGAVARAGVLVAAINGGVSPLAVTVTVNIVGSGVAGAILGGAATGRITNRVATIATVGFCGGFTTLAATTTDLARALTGARFVQALGVAMVTVVGCIGAAALGWWTTHRHRGGRLATGGATP